MKTKGFIGLGVMGFPMAGHIAKNYPTAVYNRSRPKSDDWMKVHSGRISLSPEDLGSSCNEIFMCIGNDNDVREVISGDKGILKSMSAGGIIVDHTTTSAVLSIEMSKLCMEKGVHYLDAPVSGGQAGAENGSLTIMVGGHSDAYEQAKVTMNFYSKFSKLMGPSGSGQLTKMVNQICIAGLVQGLAEGINFSEKAGLATKDVIEVISQGAAQSWQMENRAVTMLNDKFNFGFAVDLMIKDLKIALLEAKSLDLNLKVTKDILNRYKKLSDEGYGSYDTSSLIKLLK